MYPLWLRFTNPSAVQLIDFDAMYRFVGLKFGSAMPGGFSSCTFTLPFPSLTKRFDWYHKRLGYDVAVMASDRVVWDGRIEQCALSDRGLEITCGGNMRAAWDVPYNGDQSGNNGDTVISNIITASCADLTAGTLADPGIAVGQDYADNQFPGDIFSKVAEIGSGTAPYDWAVWEDKQVDLSARNTSVNWYCYRADLDSVSLARSLGNVWNSIFVDYQTAGAKATTAEAADTTSQTFYGMTRRRYISAGTVAAAAANAMSTAALAEFKDSPQQSTLVIRGKLYSTDNGSMMRSRPKWELRAGDILRVADLVSPGAISDMATRDALRVFWVRDCSYDYESDTLTISPDYPTPTVDRILSYLSTGMGDQVQKVASYFSKL